MNKLVAEPLLQHELQAVSSLGYESLAKLIAREPLTKELRGADGQLYQIEIEVRWDSHQNGLIRVLGGIDDGGWRAFAPLTLSELIYPPEASSGP